VPEFAVSWLGMIAPSTILRAVLSLAAVTLWACSLGMPMVVWRNDPAFPGWQLLVPSLAWLLMFPWILMTAGLVALLWFNFSGQSVRRLTLAFLAGLIGVSLVHLGVFDASGTAFRMGSGTVTWWISMALMALAALVPFKGAGRWGTPRGPANESSQATAAPVALDRPRREGKWPWFCVAATLVLIGWLLAHNRSISEVSAPDNGSFTFSLMVAGALPWFLQWAGVICAIFGCSRSVNARNAARFSMWCSCVLGTLWWSGLALRFRGMSPLEAVNDIVFFALKSRLGSATNFDEILFHVIGPVLGSLQLRGPLDLQGWNFLFAMFSTALLVGYLFVVGRICRVGGGPRSVMDYVKFTAAILPCFLPPFILFVIQFARTQ
jgi:hypothetical protein